MSDSWGAQVEGRRSAGGKVVRQSRSQLNFWTHTKEHLGLGQPLWVVDLDELYKALKTAHRRRALFGAVSVSKEGVPYGGVVGPSKRPELAVVWVSRLERLEEELGSIGLIPTRRRSGVRIKWEKDGIGVLNARHTDVWE